MVIFSVETGAAVETVNHLRANVKELKDRLGDLEIGTEEYQRTLNELKVNQSALKDAMYATSGSMDDLAAAAAGTSKTYNGLVHQMAAMKETLRTIDVSTDAGRERFETLAKSINEVNDELKAMDALQGNYQRNVGNYTSAFDDFGAVLKQFPPTFGAMKEQIGKVGETMQLVGKQPILGVLGLLAPIIIKITDSLKDNDTAIKAVDKALAALKPLVDLVGKAVETVAGWVAKAVDLFVSWAGESGGTFKTIIAGAVGVGNALKEFLLTPIRTVIVAVKGLGESIGNVFKGQFKAAAKSAGEAIKGIGESVKRGIDFKANFAAGKEVGEQFVAGLGSTRQKAAETGKEVVKAATEGLKELPKNWEKITSEAAQKAIDARKAAEAELKEIDAAIKEEADATLKYADETLGKIDELNAERQKEMEAQAKARVSALQMSASAAADILSSLADIYEGDGELSEEQARKVKALRIASATIDTLNGAIAAYMGTVQTIPGPLGVAMGAVQAATVAAAGAANIAKMRSTDETGGGAVSPVTASTAAVSAPAVPTTYANVRTITGAKEEERLNAMAKEQRVYIVATDIQASQADIRARVRETSY